MASRPEDPLDPQQPAQLTGKVPPELVFNDSIRALNKPIRDSSLSLMVVVLVFSIAMLGFHRWQLVLGWAVSVLAVQFVPALLFMRLVPRDDSGRRPLRALRIYYWLAAASTGLFWGVSMLVFTDPARPELQFFVALTLGGIAATNMATLAFYPAMMRSYLVLLVGPFVLWALMQELFLYKYLGAGMGLLLSHLIYFGYFHTRTLRRNIELKHANQQLVQALQARTAELENANQAKARFFAAASHDLRQPLQAMGHYASLLKPHAQDAPHVERIEQCLASLDGLLEGVLTISRLDAGKVDAHQQPVDLRAMLQRLVLLYEGVAQAKGLGLHLRISNASADQAWACSDPVLLERVLGNLLANALRYTAQGRVLVTARKRGTDWQLAVWDSGPGIAPELQEQIFDEFVQLGNPQRDPGQGVGLGLATVRRLCALLAHPLVLRSQPGQGSCFYITVPASAAQTIKSAPESEFSDQVFQGHVLLVEDNDMVRESLLHTLQGWGLQCTACTDGAQALAWLSQAQQLPDWVISDWRLPGSLHGLQVLEAARTHLAQAGRSASLVLMTGETDQSLGSLPNGVVLLRKPFRPLRLRALLAANLATANELTGR